MATVSLCHLFHESELCPEEILTILRNLDDNNLTNGIFNMASDSATPTATAPAPLMENENSSIHNKNKRKTMPAKTPSSSPPGFSSDEDCSVLSRRKRVKKQQVSPPATSVENGSGEGDEGAGGSNIDGSAKTVSHINVERNRRKQMNEHLAVLRQLLPCFYVKKGDQASIVGGVIHYINELQQVLQSLEAKKHRKIHINDVGHSNPSPLSPITPQSTNPYKPFREPSIQPPSTMNSSSPVADMITMMKSLKNTCNNDVANELMASSRSSVADIEVKFRGPNLELKTMSSKRAGQTAKIVSAIEDLALQILQVNINTFEETMLNAFTIKIGVECKLSAEELAQQIQQTFC